MNSKKREVAFITGATGFIGANLTRALLKNNITVHVLQHDKKISWRLKDIYHLLTTHYADISDYNSLVKILKKIRPDYILHLAAYGAYHYQTDLNKIVQTNIIGTKNLLEASKNIPYKCFINTGSSSEYGFKGDAMKETDFCDPVSYYAATKLAATGLCKVFANMNNKPIITFRLFSVYGPYEEPTRFIPTIMKALIKKEQINLTPGKQRRDFIYVGDVCAAYIAALSFENKLKGEVFNIGTGNEFTNDEIVKKLFSVVHKKTTVSKGTYPKRSWDTSHWVADTSHIKKTLMWKPVYTLDNGLASTYSWFEEFINLYNN
jgi:nucleoside-diphosphate-sugar epimerase